MIAGGGSEHVKGGRGGAWSVGLSGLGWALGLVGVLVPTLSSDLLATPSPPVAVLAGVAMLALEVVALVVAALALRRRAAGTRAAPVTGLVLSIAGVLGALGVLVFGITLALAWAMAGAAATGL